MANQQQNAEAKTSPGVAKRTLLQSYAALPARTRLGFSIGVCLVGVTGILISDFLEKQVPPPKTAEKAYSV